MHVLLSLMCCIEMFDEAEQLQDWMEARAIEITRSLPDINDPFDATQVKEDLQSEIGRRTSEQGEFHAPHSSYA
jgi:hypothetical protein